MASKSNSPVITPLADRVLITLIKEKEEKKNKKTAAGIILPDSVKEDEDEMLRGKIVEVGPGRTLSNGEIVPLSVKKNNQVLFKKWADKVFVNEEEYYIASESDLVAIIN